MNANMECATSVAPNAAEAAYSKTPSGDASPHRCRGKSSSHSMPGAWYDLTSRVSAVQAVASCALESLPNGLSGMAYEHINHTGNLIAAMQDLLKLMQQDVCVIEKALHA